jgi:chitooligosaccharide deacetylase
VKKDFRQLMGLGADVVDRFEGHDHSVYLTFDDSPNPLTTPHILSALKEQAIVATFFCVGANVRRHPEHALAIVKDGHEVANHSMNHLDLWRVSSRRAIEEIAECQNVLRDVCGIEATSFRAPYLHFRRALRAARNMGIGILAGCDVCPDWRETDAYNIARTLERHVSYGSIVLLHDGLCGIDEDLSRRAGMAAAQCLAMVVPQLKARGLHFRTIAQRRF